MKVLANSLNFPIGSAHLVCNNPSSKSPRWKDIADIIGHEKVFCIGEGQPIFRKKIQEGTRTVAGIKHLSAENKPLLLIEIFTVFLRKFPHEPGNSRTIDGIGDDNLVMLYQQIMKTPIFLNGITGTVHFLAEPLGDILRIAGPGKIKSNHAFLPFSLGIWFIAMRKTADYHKISQRVLTAKGMYDIY